MISSDLTIDKLRTQEAQTEQVCAEMDVFCREHQLFNVDGMRVRQLCPQFGLVFPRDGVKVLEAWRAGVIIVRDENGNQVCLHSDQVMHAA